jgi:hypothetical protein
MTTELFVLFLLAIVLAAGFGLVLGSLGYVGSRSAVGRREARRAEALRAEARIDQLTRETLQQMRETARQALRAGGDGGP